jgi:Ribonuclease G/E
MTKELFVSSTPHETKVGMVEDDLLAEIYLERENEYTLAGSIYKGRVTRVLPGMQSAFVDIGLERDAFLYVSDFMELEDSEDLDDVPTNRPAQERVQSQPQAQSSEPHNHTADAGSVAAETPSVGQTDAIPGEREVSSAPEVRDNREGMRGRRRRRGRRGERFPDSKFARPAEPVREALPADQSQPDRSQADHSQADHSQAEHQPADRQPADRSNRNDRGGRSDRPERSSRPDRSERSERSEYGPPPGYQPIILPGESISKYQRMAQSRPPVREARPVVPVAEQPAPAISQIFAGDEPLFADSAQPQSRVYEQPGIPVREAAVREAAVREAAVRQNIVGESVANPASPDWDREQKRLHEMNVAAVFGGESSEEEESDEDGHHDVDGNQADVVVHAESSPAAAVGGALEEEEIEEEEADLAHYVEELEEDAAFEELEEETHAAGEHEQATQEIAASADLSSANLSSGNLSSTELSGAEVVPFSGEAVSTEELDVAAADEVDEEAEDEAELDQAQAEAEAALAAEAGGVGMTEARAEVRAPAGTAGYTQRAPRPGYDRRPQRGGRRSGGGGRGRPRRNEQANIPLITDLLKEGQEILVQIAKEPIGKKGARITSHIALPGRFRMKLLPSFQQVIQEGESVQMRWMREAPSTG